MRAKSTHEIARHYCQGVSPPAILRGVRGALFTSPSFWWRWALGFDVAPGCRSLHVVELALPSVGVVETLQARRGEAWGTLGEYGDSEVTTRSVGAEGTDDPAADRRSQDADLPVCSPLQIDQRDRSTMHVWITIGEPEGSPDLLARICE